MNADQLFLLIAGVVVLFFFAVTLLLFFGVLRYWLQAVLTGVRLSVFDIIGTRLRRADVRAIIHKLITARMAGVEVTARQMEGAYLAGVDLDKVTLAYIQATKENLGVSFEQLVEAELQNRLAEKLKGLDS